MSTTAAASQERSLGSENSGKASGSALAQAAAAASDGDAPSARASATYDLASLALFEAPALCTHLGTTLEPRASQEEPKSFRNEAQDLPKSKPKPQKIDVENQHVFGIDF